MKKDVIESLASKPQRAFAKFQGGPWYAILPGMEESLRKAGAEVSEAPGQPRDSITIEANSTTP